VTVERRVLHVSGVVQGVGFRPVVHRLATSLGVHGAVWNGADGVTIDVEGDGDRLDRLARRLVSEAPPMARVDDVAVTSAPLTGVVGFRIAPSSSSAGATTTLPPDLAVCGDCLRELFDPADRRYRYPFITCTNCGPRLELVDGDGGSLATAEDALRAAQRLLADGGIVAVKALGGYHLMCDAVNAEAVARLRARKGRGDKPFAVLVDERAAEAVLAGVADVDEAAWTVLRSPQRSIVLLRRRSPAPSGWVESVAPGVADVGAVAQRLDAAGGGAGAQRDELARAGPDIADALQVVSGGDRSFDERDVVVVEQLGRPGFEEHADVERGGEVEQFVFAVEHGQLATVARRELPDRHGWRGLRAHRPRTPNRSRTRSHDTTAPSRHKSNGPSWQRPQ
jgi:acylphosphatase